MTVDFGSFLRLFGTTVKDPAGVARQITALRWPHEIGWMGLVATSAVSVFLIHSFLMLFGVSELDGVRMASPLADGMINFASSVITIFIIYYAGRAFGGIGTFGATLLIMTWFNAVAMVLMVAVFISALIVPGLSAFILLGAVGLTFYILAHFLNELHGFNSLLKAIGLFIMSVCGILLGMALIVGLISGGAAMGAAT